MPEKNIVHIQKSWCRNCIKKSMENNNPNTSDMEHLETFILDNINTSIIMLDDQLSILYANSAAEVLFGASRRYLEGTLLNQWLPRKSELICEIENAIHAGQSFVELEKSVQISVERLVIVDCTVNVMSNNKVLIELVQVDRHVRISREEHIFAQSSAIHQLTRGLAHEVRNPLSGLRGAAQLLEKELTKPELKEYTGIIIGEADRLQNLVSRILGGSNALEERRPINVHEALEHIRQLVSVNLPQGVSLETDYDPSIPEVQVVRDQLIQAILNIIRNSVQAVDGSGQIVLRTRARRQVTIGNQRHRLALAIDIQDNGPGIPKEIADNIFLPMVTNREDGTGLGLSISQSIIFQHGGFIEFDSNPNQTVFSIILPLENDR